MGLLLLIAGCRSCGNKQENPFAIGELQETDEMKLWECAQQVLKHRGFTLERTDFREGTIETKPLISSQWFEPWQKDLATDCDKAQASLQSLRRRVILQISPATTNNWEIKCQVIVEKLFLRQGTSDNAAVRTQAVFGQTALRSALKDRTIAEENWMKIRDDHYLGREIVDSLIQTCARKADK